MVGDETCCMTLMDVHIYLYIAIQRLFILFSPIFAYMQSGICNAFCAQYSSILVDCTQYCE